MNVDEFSSRILIILTTYNRKKATEVSIKNLIEIKKNAMLWVVDDCSDAYDSTFLKSICGDKPDVQIYRCENRFGIERIRPIFQTSALATSFEYVYHTDNDTLHDPTWIDRIYEIHKALPDYPICLFNSKFHVTPSEQYLDALDVSVRRFCPGISFFLKQEWLRPQTKWLQILSLTPYPNRPWDFVFGDLLGKPTLTSKTSYVEHFGGGGIHNKDHETDRALHPTDYLRDMRDKIINIIGD